MPQKLPGPRRHTIASLGLTRATFAPEPIRLAAVPVGA